MTTTECKTYSSNAHIPKRAYQGSAGYDNYATETKVVKPWGRTLIKLDLLIAIPEDYYRWIEDVLAWKTYVVLSFTMERLIRIIEVLCVWSFSIF